MLESFKILTVTHKTASLKDIKHYIINDKEGEDLRLELLQIKEQFGLDELYYLPTCNRVLYLFHTPQQFDSNKISAFFNYINPQLDQLNLDVQSQVNYLEGAPALQHLFEIAASIDSLVVGEREILRQLREAYDQCRKWMLFDEHLKIALDKSVVVAKSVYSKTRIGEKPVSVVSLAIQKLLASSIKNHARVVMIGAGQTNNLVGKFLAKHQFSNVTVFNRTLEKSKQLAKIVGGKALPFDQLNSFEEGFDCLIVCTGATEPIVDDALYQSLLNGEQDKKVVIDLSIPHNVCKQVTEKYNIEYIEIEGLKTLASENLAFREKEVIKAQELIEEAIDTFPNDLRQRHLEIALRSIPIEVKAVKQKAFAEVFNKEVELLDEKSLDLLERMMSYMEKKCISIPMRVARESVIAS